VADASSHTDSVVLDRARALLLAQGRALESVAGRIDEGFARAVALLAGRRGKVVV
jgi:hypothetical protein